MDRYGYGYYGFGYDPRQSGGGGGGNSGSSNDGSGGNSKNKGKGKSTSASLAASWPMPGPLQIILRRQSRPERESVRALLHASSPADRDSPAGKIISVLTLSGLVQLRAVTDIYPGLATYMDQNITFMPKCSETGWLDEDNLAKIKLAFSYFSHQAVNCMKAAKFAPSSSGNDGAGGAAALGLATMNTSRPPDAQALHAHARYLGYLSPSVLLRKRLRASVKRPRGNAAKRARRSGRAAEPSVPAAFEGGESEVSSGSDDIYKVYEESESEDSDDIDDSADSDDSGASWQEDRSSSDIDDVEEDLEEINPPQLAAKRSQETLFV